MPLNSKLSPLHVMYVEDNADIRDMVSELIDNPERRIVLCADAEAAWLQLQLQRFDVLVTDVSLPGLSGTELARRWLEADASRWVILFSGYDFKSGLASLGTNVRAIPKEDFEQLERALVEISQHLQLCASCLE
ncbi:response regulator [Simplicispira psychrophila]|uniref:response regulator n=1 Tax=Simplicispira psychrophila TaxID=80882 RepID=UPI001FE14C37|nr:response regulator [Simplicispira psychrophila]